MLRNLSQNDEHRQIIIQHIHAAGTAILLEDVNTANEILKELQESELSIEKVNKLRANIKTLYDKTVDILTLKRKYFISELKDLNRNIDALYYHPTTRDLLNNSTKPKENKSAITQQKIQPALLNTTILYASAEAKKEKIAKAQDTADLYNHNILTLQEKLFRAVNERITDNAAINDPLDKETKGSENNKSKQLSKLLDSIAAIKNHHLGITADIEACNKSLALLDETLLQTYDLIAPDKTLKGFSSEYNKSLQKSKPSTKDSKQSKTNSKQEDKDAEARSVTNALIEMNELKSFEDIAKYIKTLLKQRNINFVKLFKLLNINSIEKEKGNYATRLDKEYNLLKNYIGALDQVLPHALLLLKSYANEILSSKKSPQEKIKAKNTPQDTIIPEQSISSSQTANSTVQNIQAEAFVPNRNISPTKVREQKDSKKTSARMKDKIFEISFRKLRSCLKDANNKDRIQTNALLTTLRDYKKVIIANNQLDEAILLLEKTNYYLKNPTMRAAYIKSIFALNIKTIPWKYSVFNAMGYTKIDNNDIHDAEDDELERNSLNVICKLEFETIGDKEIIFYDTLDQLKSEWRIASLNKKNEPDNVTTLRDHANTLLKILHEQSYDISLCKQYDLATQLVNKTDAILKDPASLEAQNAYIHIISVLDAKKKSWSTAAHGAARVILETANDIAFHRTLRSLIKKWKPADVSQDKKVEHSRADALKTQAYELAKILVEQNPDIKICCQYGLATQLLKKTDAILTDPTSEEAQNDYIKIINDLDLRTNQPWARAAHKAALIILEGEIEPIFNRTRSQLEEKWRPAIVSEDKENEHSDVDPLKIQAIELLDSLKKQENDIKTNNQLYLATQLLKDTDALIKDPTSKEAQSNYIKIINVLDTQKNQRWAKAARGAALIILGTALLFTAAVIVVSTLGAGSIASYFVAKLGLSAYALTLTAGTNATLGCVSIFHGTETVAKRDTVNNPLFNSVMNFFRTVKTAASKPETKKAVTKTNRAETQTTAKEPGEDNRNLAAAKIK